MIRLQKVDITLKHYSSIAKETYRSHTRTQVSPSHNDANILANEFSEYFCDKVKKIRDGITIDLSKSPPSETRYSGDKTDHPTTPHPR